MIALLLGRLHALTRVQADLVTSLVQEGSLTQIVCVITSADPGGTRRNPLAAREREEIREWILQNRYRGRVEVTQPNGQVFWPATNAVVVAEKQ